MDKLSWSESQVCEIKSFTCGYCNRSTSSDNGYNSVIDYDNSDLEQEYFHTIYICNICGKPNYFDSDGKQYPPEIFGIEINGLPNRIHDLYSEMRMAYSFGMNTSAIMISRILIMHLAVEEGAEVNLSFVKYVDYLLENKKLSKDAKDALNFVRNLGNSANHSLTEFTDLEVSKSIRIMGIILNSIYELRRILNE